MKNTYTDRSVLPNRRKLRKDLTDAESLLWMKLRRKQLNGLRFLRQYSVGRYILDFYCPEIRLAIELDGGQHLADPEAYRRDRRKDAMLQENGYFVLRFLAEDVGKHLDDVLGAILRVMVHRQRQR